MIGFSKLFVSSVGVLLVWNLNAQGLILNPDLELCDSYPVSVASWYKCHNWYGFGLLGSGTYNGSPDYFHKLGTFPVQLPDNNGYGKCNCPQKMSLKSHFIYDLEIDAQFLLKKQSKILKR